MTSRPRKLGLVGLAVMAAGLFLFYWFDPHIHALRALGTLLAEVSRAARDARQSAERHGLYSNEATEKLAEAERAVFVENCVFARFGSKTTISEYRVIEAACKRRLLETDAETHRTLRVD